MNHLVRQLFCTFIKKAAIPIVIDPHDLEWKSIKGGGPGGQSVNKTSSCAQLTHAPTGTVIKCQKSRSLETNKHYAFKQLKDQLDQQTNGDLSKKSLKQEKVRKQRARRERRSKEKYAVSTIAESESDK